LPIVGDVKKLGWIACRLFFERDSPIPGDNLAKVR
jgi:hypothetical protein